MDINQLFTEHLQGSHNPITRQLSQRNFDRSQRRNAPLKRVPAAPSATELLKVPAAPPLYDVLRVPAAPPLTNLPEDLELLGEGPLDVNPSQYLPMTQGLSQRGARHEIDRPTSAAAAAAPSVEKVVSERGDADDLYLGSQFPLVHRVGASQVQRFGDNRTVQVFRGPNQYDSGHIADIYSPTSPAVPGTSRMVKKTGSGFKTPVAPEVDSQEDIFDDPIDTTTYSRTPRDTLNTPACLNVPFKNRRNGLNLRSVKEIPEQYQKIFNFPYFNVVQSIVFDNVMYTDKPLVLCSPTGSGKTAVFEMAIVRLLTRTNAAISRSLKIVYMAPIKALCSERFADWKAKFEPYGLKVMELTGDTMLEEFFELQEVNIILTTPEKWDSMTRRWRDNRGIIQAICLFLIDEIHVLNDSTRGATVEVVLSRMKTIQAARSRSSGLSDLPALRFVAASATITNIEDLAEWLGNSKNPAVHYKLDDSVRPVRLRKVVLGYNFIENKQSEFQFDLSLSYRLAGIINTYSEDKPSLVFCATRKSAMQGADILAKDMKSSYVYGGEHRQKLQNFSFQIRDAKLRDLVAKGIAYHHAGMDLNDRRHVEEIFAGGDLPVLVATSTLAMGVNLPAHLVVIKSTMYYHMGSHSEYPDTQVLQMIGRAGRPQFDTSATAVIMTKNQTKMKYDNLMNGTQLIESSLHKNLIEHLNAEIVLKTITDMSVAVEWLKYTFLYIRVMKNPKHYGIPMGLSRDSIEKRLQDMCMKSLNQLHGRSLISMNEDTLDVKPTETGRLMARYCISYTTMERFLNIQGSETIADLIEVVSKCEEFVDLKLRTNEKKTLNTLNKDKNRLTIRFPMAGKIKTTEMKVSCLIQAQFGNLMVQDFSLQQDTSRIFRAGTRISRCLVDVLSQSGEYKSLLSALQLSKCFKAKLWENSKHVSKQLDGIGPALSTALVNAGLTTLEKIEETNPRELELIVNRHPPFGNQLKENIASIPKYELVIEQVAKYSMQTAEILITIQMSNRDILLEKPSTSHTCNLLVGNQDNQVVFSQRIMDSLLLKANSWSKKLEIRQADKGPELSIHYVSQDWVGLDVECTYTPYYLGGKKITSSTISDKIPKADPLQQRPLDTFQPCNHICHDKMACAHDCCKFGVSSKRKNNKAQMTPKPRNSHGVANHLNSLKSRMASLPPLPNLKCPRLQFSDAPPAGDGLPDLSRFAYTPKRMLAHTVPETHDLEDEEPEEELDWSMDYGVTAGHNKSHQGQSDIGNTSSRNGARFRPGQAGSRVPDTDDMACFIDENRAPAFGGTAGKRPLPMEQRGASNGTPSVLSMRPTKKTCWAELDLYQKHRENYVEVTDDAEDSLPDLDTVPCITGGGEDPEWGNMADPQMATELWPSEDIVQETEYGLAYIQGQDTARVPTDERENTFPSRNIGSISANAEHQAIDRLCGNQFDRLRKSLPVGYSHNRNLTENPESVLKDGYINTERTNYNTTQLTGGMPYVTGNRKEQNDLRIGDIQDFSDDSFDESIATLTTREPNNSQVTGGSRLPGTGISHHSLPANKTRYHQTMRSDDSSNEHDTNTRGSHTHRGSHASFVGNSEQNSIDCDITTCGEVIESFSTDSDDKTSKWAGYASSQSSTASDCLGSKYLTMNKDNQVIMATSGTDMLSQRRYGGSTGTNRNDSSRKGFWQAARQKAEQGIGMSRGHGCYRDSSHRFGQVLAWVSDSQPKALSPPGTSQEPAGQGADNRADRYSENLQAASKGSGVGKGARSPPRSTFIFGKNSNNGSRLANIFEGLF